MGAHWRNSWLGRRGRLRPTHLGLPAGLLAGILLTFLAMAIAPSAAIASGCEAGYLSGRFRAHDRAVLTELRDLLEPGSRSGPVLPPNQPAPCSGVLCKGNPAAPPSALPGLAHAGGQQWAHSAPHLDHGDAASCLRRESPARLHPVEQAESIFRPPPVHSASLN